MKFVDRRHGGAIVFSSLATGYEINLVLPKQF